MVCGGETQKARDFVGEWGLTKTKADPKNKVYHQRKTTEPETFSVREEKETQGKRKRSRK